MGLKGPSQTKWELPAWLNHFNPHDGKIFFRCWAAAWVATVLIFIQPAIDNIGLATFFASLILFIVPPAGILSIYLFASLSLLLGMSIAWCWGLLAMKIALAARPDFDTKEALQHLKEAAISHANQTGQSVKWEAQVLVHKGIMLDARVTAVFYVLCCIFIYALARVRLANHKLVLLQLFGTIEMDIFMVFGPSLPWFYGDLGTILAKPAAIGIGIGAAASCLIFPQSTSYVVLDKMEKLIRLGEISIQTTKRRLAGHTIPSAKLMESKAKVLGLYKYMEPALKFLPLDISRGRWSSQDVQELHGPVRDAMLANLSLIDFHISRIESNTGNEAGKSSSTVDEESGLSVPSNNSAFMYALRSPEGSLVHDSIRQRISDTTADLLEVCLQSIKLATKCIKTVNGCRWIGKPPQQTFDDLEAELQSTLTTMRSTRESCVKNTTEKLLDSYRGLFDSQGRFKSPGEKGPWLLRGVVVAMVFEERVVGTASAMERVLEMILHLICTRKSHRIWMPFRLNYALSWLMDGKLSMPTTFTRADFADNVNPDGVVTPVPSHTHSEKPHQHSGTNKVHKTTARKRSVVSRAVAGTYGWLFSPGGMFALRMVIVTVATAIPSAIPRSAGFFYREKGIWGIIAAQTCMMVYMADLSFSIVSRTIGTVVGGVMGMVAWYIGSGSGIGNPYGLSAISALMVAILIWWRIFLPPAFAQASIMAGVTYALVIGFSYDHFHIELYGLPGVGYEAFWKRLVTVLLGVFASGVVQLVPKPPSATRHVRRTLSSTLSTLSDNFALLLSRWSVETEPNSILPSGAVEQNSLDVAAVLLSIDDTIKLLKFETSLGPFDHPTLRSAQELCLVMNQSLAQLLSLSKSLPQDLQRRFLALVDLLDEDVIEDIMVVLALVKSSLETGAPMPERIPVPLVRGLYTRLHQQRLTLSTAMVRDEDYRRYCVALSSYVKFLSSIDDLVFAVKGVVGECHVVQRPSFVLDN
ncbi:hypothetical protein BGZ63DRAFT_353656 [Mariannaea sp. PMI_226]|nr:hypothetical protein BGZ63DRAFT_353656 [Mariannaea sp. PMI_226]